MDLNGTKLMNYGIAHSRHMLANIEPTSLIEISEAVLQNYFLIFVSKKQITTCFMFYCSFTNFGQLPLFMLIRHIRKIY